jgi:hypothetical protein
MPTVFRGWGYLRFEFVSDFEIRAADLLAGCVGSRRRGTPHGQQVAHPTPRSFRVFRGYCSRRMKGEGVACTRLPSSARRPRSSVIRPPSSAFRRPESRANRCPTGTEPVAVKLACGRGAGAGIGTRSWHPAGMHRGAVEFKIRVSVVKTDIYAFWAKLDWRGSGVWYIFCSLNPLMHNLALKLFVTHAE